MDHLAGATMGQDQEFKKEKGGKVEIFNFLQQIVKIMLNTLHFVKKYTPLYKNIFRMVFMADKIIMKLIECADKGGSMEYSELLEFLDSLNAPQLFEEKLPPCDEEFLQLHSDFIVSQVHHHC